MSLSFGACLTVPDAQTRTYWQPGLSYRILPPSESVTPSVVLTSGLWRLRIQNCFLHLDNDDDFSQNYAIQSYDGVLDLGARGLLAPIAGGATWRIRAATLDAPAFVLCQTTPDGSVGFFPNPEVQDEFVPPQDMPQDVPLDLEAEVRAVMAKYGVVMKEPPIGYTPDDHDDEDGLLDHVDEDEPFDPTAGDYPDDDDVGEDVDPRVLGEIAEDSADIAADADDIAEILPADPDPEENPPSEKPVQRDHDPSEGKTLTDEERAVLRLWRENRPATKPDAPT